jgi:hypothetical protein
MATRDARQEEVERACAAAREHLTAAWRELLHAQMAAEESGNHEVGKSLHALADLANDAGAMCITFPRLNG